MAAHRDGSEKYVVVHDDKTEASQIGDVSDGNSEIELSPAHQRKIIRRLDIRLVATVGALYCISLMDRVNMSAANIAGMSVELNLQGLKYVKKPRSPPFASFKL